MHQHQETCLNSNDAADLADGVSIAPALVAAFSIAHNNERMRQARRHQAKLPAPNLQKLHMTNRAAPRVAAAHATVHVVQSSPASDAFHPPRFMRARLAHPKAQIQTPTIR